jgi:hypothetical protein
MVKLMLLAGLLVLIAILAALPRRVPNTGVDRSESTSGRGDAATRVSAQRRLRMLPDVTA